MNLETFKQREELLMMRNRVLSAESEKIRGTGTYTQEELGERLTKRYEGSQKGNDTSA